MVQLPLIGVDLILKQTVTGVCGRQTNWLVGWLVLGLTVYQFYIQFLVFFAI